MTRSSNWWIRPKASSRGLAMRLNRAQVLGVPRCIPGSTAKQATAGPPRRSRFGPTWKPCFPSPILACTPPHSSADGNGFKSRNGHPLCCGGMQIRVIPLGRTASGGTNIFTITEPHQQPSISSRRLTRPGHRPGLIRRGSMSFGRQASVPRPHRPTPLIHDDPALSRRFESPRQILINRRCHLADIEADEPVGRPRHAEHIARGENDLPLQCPAAPRARGSHSARPPGALQKPQPPTRIRLFIARALPSRSAKAAPTSSRLRTSVIIRPASMTPAAISSMASSKSSGS